MPGLNPVARGDLRVRLAAPRGLWAQTIFLAACGALVLLSLPPEPGRFEWRAADLLVLLVAVQMLAVTYLSSAVASSELALEGEKGLPDLTLSAFSPWTIAAGKWLSSAAYAAYLVAIGLPLLALGAALQGSPLVSVAWPAGFTAVVATAAGVWGAWLGGRFSSDFTRSFVHWGGLAVVFVVSALLPEPWWAINPIRVADLAVRTGWQPWMALPALAYLVAAALGAVTIAGQVRAARLEA